jgi:hypothetical protein
MLCRDAVCCFPDDIFVVAVAAGCVVVESTASRGAR